MESVRKSPSVARPSVAFVSPTVNAHSVRWIVGLRELGIGVTHLAEDEFGNQTEFFHHVRQLGLRNSIIIAGPLEIAQRLAEHTSSIVLLSWGFDLQDAAPDIDLSGFAGVIVDSHANEEIAREFGAPQTVLIPWGIDLDSTTGEDRVADLTVYGVSVEEKVVLSLRAHEELYRVADIIEAFARTLPKAHLVIGNTGSLTSHFQQLASNLGVDAVFLPPVEESDVPALLRRASVYVTASRVDGTSVTLLQAMACGVPVVASANSGNLEWVDDGVTGFLFPIADVDALGASVQRALNEGSSVTHAALAQVIQRANWKTNITKLDSLLTRLP